jgi:hypothetical protein
MRNVLLAATTLATLAIPTVASAQYYYDAADVYAPPPAVYVNPPVTTYVTPGAVVRPPVVAAPMVESQVYLAPGATYVQPGVPFADAPIIIDGQRYYRDCWWDWGTRRCDLKRWY